MSIYLGLVHSPVRNKEGKEVTTSVTNLDIHDIARSCRTFGVKHYCIITPVEAQHELVGRIVGYWKTDQANVYNPDRFDALSSVRLHHSIEESIAFIENEEGIRPFVAVTGAKLDRVDGDVAALQVKNALDKKPILLLFGTGWGLTASIIERADFRLLPIVGLASDGYNHLSVRSAVAIYLNQFK